MSTQAPGLEFGFVEGIPVKEPGLVEQGARALAEVMRQYEEATKEHGPIVPMATVAEQLGVSTQRVQNLVNEGRIASVGIAGRRWVIGKSALEYLAAGPRKPGRPKKLTVLGNSYRLGKELAATAEKLID